MKRIHCLVLVPLLIVCAASRAFAAEPVADVFREGLFEEEANRNLPAAIQAYEEVVQRLDEQRRLAATAVFRLGECHRKLGQTEEAIAAFERVVREFPGEETLVKLSRENLVGLRGPTTESSAATPLVYVVRQGDTLARIVSLYRPLYEARGRTLTFDDVNRANPGLDASRLRVGQRILIPLPADQAGTAFNFPGSPVPTVIAASDLQTKRALLAAQLATITNAPNDEVKIQAALSATSDTVLSELLSQRMNLEQDLVAKQAIYGSDHPEVRALAERRDLVAEQIDGRVETLVTVQTLHIGALEKAEQDLPAASPQAARAEQRALLEQEIALVEEELERYQRRFQVGTASQAEGVPLMRDLLSLRRELAGLDAARDMMLPLPTESGPAASAADAEWVQREIQLVEEQLAELEAHSTDRESTDNSEVLSLMRDLRRLKRQLPESSGADQQKELLQEELALVQRALEDERLLVEAGRAESATVLSLERELLGLQRQAAAVQEAPAIAAVSGSDLAPATSEEAEEIRRIQALVANSPDLINAQGEGQTTTPLMNAALKGQLAVARYLLDHGARVNQASSDDDSRTALSLAVHAGHRTMAELLLERGATVAPQVAETPLHLAALQGFVSLAELLVSKGADVNYQWDRERGKNVTPLWRAVQNNHEPMVRFLLDHGADPNLAAQNVSLVDGGTPLSVASSASMVQLLLDHGADPNGDKSARLMKAIDRQERQTLIVLLDAGAEVNVQAPVPPDERARAFVASVPEKTRTPLTLAASKAWLEGAKLLREHGADPNLADASDQKWTPLHHAVHSAEMVRWLLGEGAVVNAKDAEGRSALDILMGWMRSLLSGPASLNFRVPQPPGEAAPPPRVWDVVLVLVQAGADPMTSVSGYPLIHCATAAGRIDVLEALKEHGASLDARGEFMVTPLMVAVGMSQVEALDWLLKNGADVNLQNEEGNTALHFAAWNQSFSLAKRLVEAGASRTVRNVLEEIPAECTDPALPIYGRDFGLPRLRSSRPGEMPVMQPMTIRWSSDALPTGAPGIAELQQLLAPPPDVAPAPETPTRP